MSDYYFRLNTRAGADQFHWRVWEDGHELDQCAVSIELNVPAQTVTTQEPTPDLFGSYHRYNIGCRGRGHWQGHTFKVDTA